MGAGTWRTSIVSALARPLGASVIVVNPTEREIRASLWLQFNNGRTRTTNVTLAPGGSYAATVRTLAGSLVSDTTSTTLTSLLVTCDAGRVSCPVSFSLLAVPVCTPAP